VPNLLTAKDVRAAHTVLGRDLPPGGVLILSTRPYDEIRKARPASAPPQAAASPYGRSITFQLWDWHEDGERYDLEHFQLVPDGTGKWDVRVRRTTYWALTQNQLSSYVIEAGFVEPQWRTPESTGFFQPLLTARATGPCPSRSDGR
jgi:glycine/sarcosine N-methyltransferase